MSETARPLPCYDGAGRSSANATDQPLRRPRPGVSPTCSGVSSLVLRQTPRAHLRNRDHRPRPMVIPSAPSSEDRPAPRCPIFATGTNPVDPQALGWPTSTSDPLNGRARRHSTSASHTNGFATRSRSDAHDPASVSGKKKKRNASWSRIMSSARSSPDRTPYTASTATRRSGRSARPDGRLRVAAQGPQRLLVRASASLPYRALKPTFHVHSPPRLA